MIPSGGAEIHLRAGGGWKIANLSLRAEDTAISLFRHHPLDCFVAKAPRNDRDKGKRCSVTHNLDERTSLTFL